MNTALILSGGTGSRLKADMPKQYLEVDGKPILLYSLQTICKSQYIDKVQIVAALEWQEQIVAWLQKYDLTDKFAGFSLPGENRQLSIYNGVLDIYEREENTEGDLVFIHDAARPCLSADMIASCFAAMEGYDGVLPVLPMKDTVYLSEDGKQISSLLNRSQIFAGQAPELFKLGMYLEANKSLLPDKIKLINGSSEPAVMYGMQIAMIPGEEGNYKITTQADLERFTEQISRCD